MTSLHLQKLCICMALCFTWSNPEVFCNLELWSHAYNLLYTVKCRAHYQLTDRAN